jgi:hypothetical protein
MLDAPTLRTRLGSPQRQRQVKDERRLVKAAQHHDTLHNQNLPSDGNVCPEGGHLSHQLSNGIGLEGHNITLRRPLRASTFLHYYTRADIPAA